MKNLYNGDRDMRSDTIIDTLVSLRDELASCEWGSLAGIDHVDQVITALKTTWS